MNQELENYYMKQPEPIQGCLLALKSIILSVDKEITHRRLYQIPVFYYKEKRLAYLWVHRKQLLLGIVTDKSVLTFPEGGRPKDQYARILVQVNLYRQTLAG